MRTGRSWGLFVITVLAIAGFVSAEKKDEKPVSVDFFDGAKAGDFEVKVIPQDANGGNLIIKNKTDKPLSIKLPEAFAGVPVAAQFGGGGGGQFGGGGGGGGNQGFGGGMGGGGFGGGGGGFGGGGGGGGGFFNVPAGKEGKLKYISVCLEHGKKDPSPHVAYELKPIESFTSNQAVVELVKMFGRGEIDARAQHSVQAAAWHLANGLTWDEMARKIGVKHIGGRTEPYFQESHLQQALVMTQVATQRAEKVKSEAPSKADSLSRQ